MATQAAIGFRPCTRIGLEQVAAFPKLRVLAWDGETLYASRGYELLSAQVNGSEISWEKVGAFRPALWRNITSRSRLTSRLFRDGFHALAVHSTGKLVGAVPGAIVTLPRNGTDFQVTHRIRRGTRPLHITSTTFQGPIYWGEYFDNADRNEVHIYGSEDGGSTWRIAYTFKKREIRHVHNIVYDSWEQCLWIFTGDYGRECRILRASTDFRAVDEVLAGNQQARAVAAVITKQGLFFASDTPLEQNYLYFMDRNGTTQKLHAMPSSSIHACRNRVGMFFSTMVEPSDAIATKDVAIFGSADGRKWESLCSWHKDRWPMKFFQYGNAFLPDGENRTDFLAATTVAVESGDRQTTIWRTSAI